MLFGGSGGLGSGVVNLLADSGVNVAFTYLTNEKAAKESGSTAKSANPKEKKSDE